MVSAQLLLSNYFNEILMHSSYLSPMVSKLTESDVFFVKAALWVFMSIIAILLIFNFKKESESLQSRGAVRD